MVNQNRSLNLPLNPGTQIIWYQSLYLQWNFSSNLILVFILKSTFIFTYLYWGQYYLAINNKLYLPYRSPIKVIIIMMKWSNLILLQKNNDHEFIHWKFLIRCSITKESLVKIRFILEFCFRTKLIVCLVNFKNRIQFINS